MRLFHAPASPFVRKVMIVAHETGLIDRITVQPASGNAVEPGTMPVDLNPLGKIPALDLGPEGVLYDSRVICRYLDTLAGTGFYPEAPKLWQTLTLEATADGIMDAAVLMVYEARIRPEEIRFAPWLDGQWAKISRALDALEGKWAAHLAGPLDMGQIAVGAALGYLDFRLATRDWRAGRAGLTQWYAAFSARPAMVATRPQG